MAKNASGIQLTQSDARLILGMVARGDRDHDIAAWFGVNQGRIAEVKKGDYGTLVMAPENELPPSGPPGLKGRRLKASVERAATLLRNGEHQAADDAISAALAKFDANER